MSDAVKEKVEVVYKFVVLGGVSFAGVLSWWSWTSHVAEATKVAQVVQQQSILLAELSKDVLHNRELIDSMKAELKR